MHIHTSIYIHRYIHTYICVQTYIHIHTHTYTHTYIHTHRHTYKHTDTLESATRCLEARGRRTREKMGWIVRRYVGEESNVWLD